MSETEQKPVKPGRGTARSAAKIMAAIMGSRVLGLVREIVLNAVFGAGKELDAFLTAFRIPNLLRDLFAEGALSAAFVTTFSRKLEKEGRETAFRLANLVFTSMAVGMGALVLAGILGSGWIVELIAPGFGEVPGKTELTVELTRMLFPFILLVSLAAVMMGLLNSLGSFGLPASASTAFNATSILAGLALGYWYDPGLGPRAIYGFAIGTVLGGAVQFLIQLPKALGFGFRPALLWAWSDPGLRQVYWLTLPAVVGASAVQVNVLVNTWFASYLGDGAITWLNNAFRLMQLPIGMFGVAVSMVVLPQVSRSVAREDMEAFREHVVEGLRLALFLTLPAAVGLALLAEPVIGMLYERGAFTAADTAQTALALQGYALGLAAYACIKVMTPTFYALDVPRVPVAVSLGGIVLNICLNTLFIWHLGLGIVGLPLSVSLVALLNMAQLALSLRLRLGPLGAGAIWVFAGKMLVAVGLMTLVVWGVQHAATPLMGGGFVGRAGLLAVVIPLGAGVYAVVAYALRMEELAEVLGVLRRKAAKKS